MTIDGLRFIPDVVTPDEEQAIVDQLEPFLVANRQKTSFNSRTTVIRWGAHLYQGPKTIGPIPAFLAALGARMPMREPESVTMNLWNPGDSLQPHVDKGGETVCILGLLSTAKLQYVRKGKTALTVTHEPRSILSMCGEARWQWEHAVLPMKARRISLIFRTLGGPDGDRGQLRPA